MLSNHESSPFHYSFIWPLDDTWIHSVSASEHKDWTRISWCSVLTAPSFNREVTLCTSQLSRRTGVTGESRARRTHSLSEWRWWLSAHSPAWRLSNKDLFLCERWTHPMISAEREDMLCDDWRSLRFAKKSTMSGRLIMQLLLQNKSLLVVLWLEAVASTRARLI